MKGRRFFLVPSSILFMGMVQANPIFVFTPDIHASADRWPDNTVIVQKTIMEKIASLRPQAVILGGDEVDRGARNSDWDAFSSITAALANTTIYPTLGNHELYNWSNKTSNNYITDIPNGKKNFNVQFANFYADHAPATRNGYYYSINNAGVHLISLDMHLPKALSGLLNNGAQFNWLVNDLQSDEARLAKYIVVVSHLPIHPAPCGKGLPGEAKTMNDLFVKLDPLFKQYKVSVVLGGHLHCYKRSTSQSPQTNLPYYVVAGTSGAPNSSLGYLQFTTSQSTMKIDKINLKSNGFVVSDSFSLPAK